MTSNKGVASQKSAGIFDTKSIYFRYTIYIGLSIFLLLLIAGVIWEFINSRNRSKAYAQAAVEEPRGKAFCSSSCLNCVSVASAYY